VFLEAWVITRLEVIPPARDGFIHETLSASIGIGKVHSKDMGIEEGIATVPPRA